MAKKKRIRAPPPPPPFPRNTVTLWLDGTPPEVGDNFKRCQAHLYYWNLCRAAFRVRHGNWLLYTTPLDGTFYYVVRYSGRFVVFVIQARPAWLLGFYNAKGFFEVRSREIDGFYMDSYHTKPLHFNRNHKDISPGGTGNTSVNLYAARRQFDELCNYKGPDQLDQQGVPAALGFYVILIMEPKCREIFLRHCNSLIGSVDVRLGNDWVKRAINNWSTGSEQALHSFDDVNYEPHDCGLVHLKDLDDILGLFFYLHVDGFSSGMFSHEPMEPEPRKLTWERIDDGFGDGDIAVLQEPHSDHIGHISCRGARKRQATSSAESLSDKRIKKRKGLSGGGLGGPPEAPIVFVEWMDSNNDEQSSGNLITHLASMGLKVLDSKREAISWTLKRLVDIEKLDTCDRRQEERAVIAVTSESLQQSGNPEEELITAGTSKGEVDGADNIMSDPIGNSNKTGLCSVDLESLGPGKCITDPIIDSSFKTLSRNLRRSGVDNVLLVRPMISFFICNGSKPFVARTVEQLQLSTRRLVLFPVNNNNKMDQADGPSHWSLLVLDQWTQHQPRLIHYDSASAINFNKAAQLSSALQPYVAENTRFTQGLIPQQENPYDCGIYVINCARVICRWCEAHASSNATAGIEDWSTDLWSEVNAENASLLRNKFRANLAKQLSNDSC